jgi:hypothetical protein
MQDQQKRDPHKRLRATCYIHKLSLSTCWLTETKHHPQHGELRPTQTPPLLFHTVSMDLVVALRKSLNGFDALMTATCKASKMASVAVLQSHWTAE